MDSSTHGLEFHAPSIEELQPLFPAYEISGFIAQGGMGAVYAARQVSLDRRVAIKILPRQFGADPQFRSSFEAEAKSMARLNHPNLIGVYDFGDVDGMLYIIMELVEGKSLHHSAHGKRIEQREAARIVAGISHGLAHAHHHGILHRDIKPGNILLGPGAVPKIGDFGLARPVGAGHNPDEIVWGTPGYSAPEVVNNPDAVDQRADIFAVGVLLYELLTAQVPTEAWQAPSTISKCNPAFDSIIRRATHPSPELRYSDAEDLAKDLDGLLARRQGAPLAASAPRGSNPLIGVRPASSALSSSKSKTAPVLIACLLCGVVAVGALIVAASRNDDKATRDAAQEELPPPKPVPKHQPVPIPEPPPKTVATDAPKTKPPEDKPKPEPPKPDLPKASESPTQALARLKAKLKLGELSDLPKGAAKRSGAHFFLVDQPLTWQAAYHFAEDHGAQLAVLDSAEAVAWASSQFTGKSPAWIGLSDSGTESKWFWTDGGAVDQKLWAPGQPDDTPSRDDGEDFGALLPGGSVDDLPASRKLPFLLQWNDGSANQGTISMQLGRVGEALKSKRLPIFPAGSRNIGGSRFLLVPKAVSWDEASAIATAAGGHLAVPSNQAEADWITDSLQQALGGGDACWVGGRILGTASPQWTYVTGEKFQFVRWAPGQPDQADRPQPALQVWRGVDGRFGYNKASSEAGQANYFMVEWSARSRRNMPSKGDLKRRAASAQDWLTDQRQRVAAHEKVAFQRWKRRHDKNVKDFVNDIKSEAETASRFSKAAKDFVKSYTKTIEDGGVIPAKLGNERARRWVGSIHKKALEKQKKSWEDYESDFLDAQKRYLADLEAEIDRRRNVGDGKGAGYLSREKEAADENPYFLEILEGEFPPVPEEEAGDEGENKNNQDGDNQQ